MNVEKILEAVTPQVYEQFKLAVELGKWPDGRLLTSEQKHTCMQALIAYETKNMKEEDRSWYVPPKATLCEDKNETGTEEQPIKWDEGNK